MPNGIFLAILYHIVADMSIKVKKLKRIMTEIEVESKPKPKPKTDANQLKERMRKLNVMYMNGGLDDDEYLAQSSELKALIEKATLESSEIERDITPLQGVLKMDLIPTYEAMSEEDKRRFWRAIIKEIHVEGNEVKGVVFL